MLIISCWIFVIAFRMFCIVSWVFLLLVECFYSFSNAVWCLANVFVLWFPACLFWLLECFVLLIECFVLLLECCVLLFEWLLLPIDWLLSFFECFSHVRIVFWMIVIVFQTLVIASWMFVITCWLCFISLRTRIVVFCMFVIGFRMLRIVFCECFHCCPNAYCFVLNALYLSRCFVLLFGCVLLLLHDCQCSSNVCYCLLNVFRLVF